MLFVCMCVFFVLLAFLVAGTFLFVSSFLCLVFSPIFPQLLSFVLCFPLVGAYSHRGR